ncbi:MAG TPA: OST-HTH/LOTUS domain-containing protein, partial [Longimicrobiaceae bacterium]|nr:OST-HTH/LOTUS domain-containing protein [Longimicrobiaceae bacterium]
TRAGEVVESKEDPWVLAKRATQQMVANGDVMRTDRLKQVMLELDPAFDEKKIGYNKFSRFVQEAARKGVFRLHKGENGQFEISVGGGAAPEPEARSESGNGRRGRGRGRERTPRAEEPKPIEAAPEEPKAEEKPAAREEKPREQPAAEAKAAGVAPGIENAYALLQEALRTITDGSNRPVRDGDVKRKMLDLAPNFDESDLGFSKFTRFLRQAHDAEIIDLQRVNGGNYEVSLPANGKNLPAPKLEAKPGAEKKEEKPAAKAAEKKAEKAPEKPAEKPTAEPTPSADGRGMRTRRGRAGAPEGPPPLLPGQVVKVTKEEAQAEAKETPKPSAEEKPAKKKSTRSRSRKPAKKAEPAAPAFSAEALNLPHDRAAIEAYLTNSYKGVGKKTAEQLTEAFGDDVFQALATDAEKVKEVLGPRRAGTVLQQWEADYARRTAEQQPAPEEKPAPGLEAKPKKGTTRRGGRGRGGRKKTTPAS